MRPTITQAPAAEVRPVRRFYVRLKSGSAALICGALTACGPSGAAPSCPKTASGTPPNQQPVPQAGEPETLHTSSDIEIAQQTEGLTERLRGDAFVYFRFTNRGFSRRVCEHFATSLPVWPQVNLHGDAHVEQFAVTGDGSGLADFDDATLGPAAVDLVRFGVSLRLAADRTNTSAKAPIAALMHGYRQGLSNGPAPPEPSFVAELRRALPTRQTFLTEVDALIVPFGSEKQSEFMAGYDRYTTLMGEQYPELPPGFFTIRKAGKVGAQGVGSNKTVRYLARVEGPTAATDDDVVLEAKELSPIRDVPCVHSLGGALRVVVSQARLGLGSTRFLAAIPRGPNESFEDAPFWVQEWRHDYREVDVADMGSEERLSAVSERVGYDLGRGHTAYVGAPLDLQLQRAQLDLLDELEPEVGRAIDELYVLTKVSWQKFVDETKP